MKKKKNENGLYRSIVNELQKLSLFFVGPEGLNLRSRFIKSEFGFGINFII